MVKPRRRDDVNEDATTSDEVSVLFAHERRRFKGKVFKRGRVLVGFGLLSMHDGDKPWWAKKKRAPVCWAAISDSGEWQLDYDGESDDEYDPREFCIASNSEPDPPQSAQTTRVDGAYRWEALGFGVHRCSVCKNDAIN